MADTRPMDQQDSSTSETAWEDETAFEQEAENGYLSEGGRFEDQKPSGQGQDGRKSMWSRIKWGRVALAVIFLFTVLALALFAWNRWYRFDDITDIQGTWRDLSSGATLEVNATHLKLAEDAVYEYTLDPIDKRLSYSFGNTEGFSSYRFSEDRTQLVLEDSAETDWGMVLHFRDDPGFAEGSLPEGTTRLQKVSSDVPTIVVPGSNRPASAVTISKPNIASSSSSAAQANGVGAASSATTHAPQASQTEPDENGLIVGPDRNAKGYYDDQGIFVPVSYGHFDEAGNWVEDGAGGYLDSEGNWIEGAPGYYDANGTWVLYNSATSDAGDTQSATNTDSASGEGYYDQYGNWVSVNALPSDTDTGAGAPVNEGDTRDTQAQDYAQ